MKSKDAPKNRLNFDFSGDIVRLAEEIESFSGLPLAVLSQEPWSSRRARIVSEITSYAHDLGLEVADADACLTDGLDEFLRRFRSAISKISERLAYLERQALGRARASEIQELQALEITGTRSLTVPSIEGFKSDLVIGSEARGAVVTAKSFSSDFSIGSAEELLYETSGFSVFFKDDQKVFQVIIRASGVERYAKAIKPAQANAIRAFFKTCRDEEGLVFSLKRDIGLELDKLERSKASDNNDDYRFRDRLWARCESKAGNLRGFFASGSKRDREDKLKVFFSPNRDAQYPDDPS